jgi:hypothetical protein
MITTILTIWLKIIGIIIAWEVWKYLGWRIACWMVDRDMGKLNGKHK